GVERLLLQRQPHERGDQYHRRLAEHVVVERAQRLGQEERLETPLAQQLELVVAGHARIPWSRGSVAGRNGGVGQPGKLWSGTMRAVASCVTATCAARPSRDLPSGSAESVLAGDRGQKLLAYVVTPVVQ